MHAALFRHVIRRGRLGTVATIIVELSVTCLGGALIWALAGSPIVVSFGPRSPHLAMTFTAAIVAGAIVIVGCMAAQTLRDSGTAWLGAAFALYTLVAVCLTLLGSGTLKDDPGLLAAASAANLLVVIALLLAGVSRPRLGGPTPWASAAAGAAVAGLCGWAGTQWPPVLDLLRAPAAQVTVAVGWSAAAMLTIVTGYRQREPMTRRIGFGVAIVGAAQSYRAIAGGELAEPDVLFASLALLGFSGVLAGSAGRFRGMVTGLLSDRDRQRAELGEAGRHAFRAADLAAERDHELANGLAALSGIAFLLDEPADAINRPALRSAVLAELSRLQTMLSGPANSSGTRSYDAADVVTELAVLRRAAGTDIEVETDGDLRVTGKRDALAQALTNLLANCERHAPGSPVRIRARRRKLDVVVDVRDEGPGIPVGAEKSVLQRGVTIGATGGTGLGLDVSARLLNEQGGTLRILPRGPDQGGFSVRLALPTPYRAT